MKIAGEGTGGRRGRRIPLWYHGCAAPIFLFVLVMVNVWSMLMPLLGGIFGFLYFFYWKRGRSPEEFDRLSSFIRNFKLSDISPLLRGIVIGPLVAAGIFAPFRAAFLGPIWMFGWFDAYTAEFHPGSEAVLMYAFDAAYGVCGTTLGVLAGSLTWIRALRLKRQLANLPTSTVRGASIGLSELRGVARHAEGQPRDEEGDEDAPDTGDGTTSAILFHSLSAGEGKTRGKTVRTRFYLEDETGRIRVDPRGVEFWDGKGSFMWRPIRCIYLEKHFTEEVLPYRSVAMLLPGDSVYVIGTVEEREDAPHDAADSDRLVIRPASRLYDTGLFSRILFGDKDKTTGKDFFDIFFLTDVTERSAAEILAASLRGVWTWTAVWVALSLSLVVAFLPRLL